MGYREDVGTTTRLRMTGRRALRAWERTKGVCVTCQDRIDGVKDQWFVEHIRALELGGEDKDENLGPAHVRCKLEKDAADHTAAAQAKRRKRVELGIGNQKQQGPRLQSRGFTKAPPQRKASKPLEKQLPPRRNPWSPT